MAIQENYKTILDNALKANKERVFYAQYPEHPKAYGEDATKKALDNFQNMLNKKFTTLKQAEASDFKGEEVSPYTNDPLNVSYPIYDADEIIGHTHKAFESWKKVSVEKRSEVLILALEKIKEKFFEIAFATMHTTGQSFMMSFQASGPHSADRALEAMAMGYQELSRFPEELNWKKPMGKFDVELKKKFKPVPKGIGLVIGCSTFPVWNSVPGIFANLITGNSVVVKPHPGAVLPIAIVIAEIQSALSEKGLDPNTVFLASDTSGNLITKDLCERNEIHLIDYTGGPGFGDYVENLKGKSIFTEKAGVNSVILDSVANLDEVLQNLSFAVSLYSGQMCTAPQNFFIPETGINTAEGKVDYNTVIEKLKTQISGLANHPKMGAGTLGAIQNPATLQRVKEAESMGAKVILSSSPVKNEEFPNARTVSPIILEVSEEQMDIFAQELFGPIIVVVKTKNTNRSIELARDLAGRQGAITCAAYTTDDKVAEKIEAEMEKVFAPVSFNFTGPIWVNQHAAFSDFHVTGGNPAGNASFTNPDFINRRFVWVGHRYKS
ncbi:MAG: phenylacetic acid degradation protein PaaN [Chitinophagaceae bacterium]|nr:MAG: phenylacetic acid degradation protein PaaN [Chitinophagaceae bacterium]